MAVVSNESSSAFELKSATLSLVAVLIKTTDLALLAQALTDRFGDAPGLFDQDPVAIDLAPVRESEEAIDFPALIALLRTHQMLPLAVRGGSEAQMSAAMAAGLTEASTPPPARRDGTTAVAGVDDAAAAAREDNAPPPGDAPPDARPATEAEPATTATEFVAGLPPESRPSLVVDRPLRAGQRVYAKGADLIVLAAVNPGAEVIADGNVHVYGPLRGRALAGALGDTEARIFTTCMQPQLISIAGIYRTTDTELPAAVLGKPAQVRLDGEKLQIDPLKTD